MLMNFQKILTYNNLSILWLDKDPNNRKTKLGRNIEKLSKSIAKLLQPLNDLNEEREIDMNDINCDNALTNPITKAFVYDIIKDKDGADVQKFQYTPESRKKRDLEIRARIKKYNLDLEAMLSKEIEFTLSHYTSEIPPNVTEEEIESFKDIVISSDKSFS